MPGPSQMTAAKKTKFLDTLREGHSVLFSARAAGYKSQASFRRLKDTDKTFGEAWLEAYADGGDVLLEAAFERAVVGIPKGGPRVFSDRLLAKLIDGRFPQMFRPEWHRRSDREEDPTLGIEDIDLAALPAEKLRQLHDLVAEALTPRAAEATAKDGSGTS